ncbi:MAG TPA: DNA alkylation repair protein [Anaerolineales bacterium]|nr:DNA alkylation repair protein [Anaerolineales bacterium]
MPAVDLARLAHQVEHVRAAVGDPATFRGRFLDLMALYADRTRRSRAETGPGLPVPSPVIKALANGLAEETEAEPERAALVADILWNLETRPARLIAVTLLRRQNPSDLLDRVLAWSDRTDDPEVLEQLAGPALAPVRSKQPDSFLEAMAELRRHFQHRRRAFALLALRSAVEDRAFQAVHRVLELVPPRSDQPIAEERRALRELVVALGRRTPGETSRWLGEALSRKQAWAYPAAQAAVEALPERSRRSLERSLLAARAAGIISNHRD